MTGGNRALQGLSLGLQRNIPHIHAAVRNTLLLSSDHKHIRFHIRFLRQGRDDVILVTLSLPVLYNAEIQPGYLSGGGESQHTPTHGRHAYTHTHTHTQYISLILGIERTTKKRERIECMMHSVVVLALHGGIHLFPSGMKEARWEKICNKTPLHSHRRMK